MERRTSLLLIAAAGEAWIRERMLTLIKNYEANICLWAVKSHEYTDRQKKEVCVAGIVLEMKDNDAITADVIEKKLHNMRSQYARERKQVE